MMPWHNLMLQPAKSRKAVATSHPCASCGGEVGAQTIPCLQPGLLRQVTYKPQGIWTNKLQNTAPGKQCSLAAFSRGSEDTAGDCNLFSHTPRGMKLFLHNDFICTAEPYECKGKPWNKLHLPQVIGAGDICFPAHINSRYTRSSSVPVQQAQKRSPCSTLFSRLSLYFRGWWRQKDHRGKAGSGVCCGIKTFNHQHCCRSVFFIVGKPSSTYLVLHSWISAPLYKPEGNSSSSEDLKLVGTKAFRKSTLASFRF